MEKNSCYTELIQTTTSLQALTQARIQTLTPQVAITSLQALTQAHIQTLTQRAITSLQALTQARILTLTQRAIMETQVIATIIQAYLLHNPIHLNIAIHTEIPVPQTQQTLIL